jgi:hypothetical protein
MAILAAFQPTYGAGITETATTTSVAYLLDPNANNSGGGNKSACVSNQGATNGVYVRIGRGDAIVATDADLYVAPGQQLVLSKSDADNYIAILAAASTSAVHAIPGEGLCIG